MAEEQQIPASQPDDIQEVAVRPEKDPFLQELVDNVNLSPANRVGITLQMHGMLVSGTMIPGDRYFEMIAQELASSDEARAAISGRGDSYRRDREEDSFDPNSNTAFIHLEDCAFHTSTQLVKSKVLWRGRISEVQGFFVGTISTVRD